MTSSPSGLPSPALAALARAHGVATEWWDWQGSHTVVSDASIHTVLTALGIQVESEQDVQAALADVDLAPWRRTLPPVVVMREGWTPWVTVHVPHGEHVELELELESGQWRWGTQVDHPSEPRWVDGVLMGAATFELPGDLPLGWHQAHSRSRRTGGIVHASCPVVVTPQRVDIPDSMWVHRAWGLMQQVYAVRSATSWGIGDLTDLAELGSWAGAEHGADFVLINPLHAAEPVSPMEPSPYLPTTRRFANPVYIGVEQIPEIAHVAPKTRRRIRELATSASALNESDTIDRDAAWTLKREALELVFEHPRSARRQREFSAFRRQEGDGLIRFATWAAWSEQHGAEVDSWTLSADEIIATADPHRVDFHCWLQWVLDEQLEAGQAACKRAGMRLGIVHDLAVGVHPTGADVWGLGAALATGVTVGAPPDQYSQVGQDWSQPPWRPDRLAELGYAPYRDMLRTILRHAGGIRVDHIIGLFRLWWVPQGGTPREGTYVRYDYEALIGILVLEAARAGAVVIGEDLGTVEPGVRDYLLSRGILGTSIMWFERDGMTPRPPEAYRELCLASVTTHDLPPTRGYLEAVHVDIRHEVGMLTRSVQEEKADSAAEQEIFLRALRDRGFVDAHPTTEEFVVALHRFLAATPARMIALAVPDLVGDRRPVNQPGTDEEYPNWRIAVTDPDGAVMPLEAIMASESAARLCELLRD